ncbi:ABC transporter permease [Phycicoccus sp. MAQZ13P-2]|uniref:ABC transporter permease n=1 Tax=Phycicoccus mangrovi TaxID=2840470 RepID=UPI001C005546|nr:ABC transporter permease [Phycicoccus mangrovi]MBT9256195.1 ABC transporter permease [Phycicoccus mangrovi]MBT9273790.1 ABC transporter permease [Phycicoccus mangrovi]
MSTVSTPVPTRSHPVADAMTMLGRQLRHARRYPELTVIVLLVPVVLLVLFVLVFGGTLGAGLGPVAGGGRGTYADYVLPGILVMTVASIAQGTSTTMAMDTTQGIIDRFRTLSISPGAVLSGHVLAATIQSVASMAVVTGVGLTVGFRPRASLTDWLLVLALLTGLSLAVSWLSVALGLASRTVESASNYPMPLVLLPFLGSGFVPTESMPAGLAWFAEHQPFTPVMDALRGLLLGTGVTAGTAWLAAGWCVVMAVAGWWLARRLYARPRRA